MPYEPFEGSVIVPGYLAADKTVKSARRTIELFEFFIEHRQPANLLTISQALKYPASSTAALAKTLSVLGYLHFDPATRTYFPTLRISLLGGWLQEQYFSDTRILALMNAIARDTRQTVILAMQSGIHVQYLMVIQGHEDLRAYIRIGSLRPICRASTGMMLLTLAPSKTLRGIVNHANSLEPDASARVSFRELTEELQRCRERGYATTSGNVTPGLGTVAILLPQSEKHVPLAIAVGGPVEVQRTEKDRWISIMRERIASHYPA